MIIKKVKAYIQISRPGNGIMAIIGVLLGCWLSNNELSYSEVFALAIAAISALSFGNVINDIKDLEGDKINHPDRPLPSKILNLTEAYIFTLLLSTIALATALFVSKLHFYITLTPLIFLVLYTLFFKATPLVGNFVVSLLVAYTLVFGAIGSQHIQAILLPALLAFLLNMEREIIKDFQDVEGDSKTGIKTTASLPKNLVNVVLAILSFLYILILPIPALTEYYSKIYLIFSIIFVLPLHILVSSSLLNIIKWYSPKKISKLIKIEMLLGLIALSIDKALLLKF